MNKKHPHDIVDDIKSIPAEQRRDYRPIKPNDAAKLRKMTPEERGGWLKDHPIDLDRLTKANEKRARRGLAVDGIDLRPRLAVDGLDVRPKLGVDGFSSVQPKETK